MIVPPRPPLNVLVIDDSAVVREAMKAILSRAPDMRVTVAGDPLIAMEKMKRVRPDVIVLDLEMPRMHGLDFLRKLMAEDPLPVVVCSALTAKGTASALRALSEGAVAVVAKPELGIRDFLHESAVMLTDTVRGAAQARLRSSDRTRHPSSEALRPVGAASKPPSPQSRPLSSRPPPPLRPDGTETRRLTPPPPPSSLPTPRPSRSALPAASARSPSRPCLPAVRPPPRAPVAASAPSRLIAIGASTGGTEAIRELLLAMPEDAPPIVIVQHMPPVFTAAFAASLALLCRIEVKEAAHGDRVHSGRALVAPGGRHMSLLGSVVGQQTVLLSDGPLVSGHRPSVDVLFSSVARVSGRAAVGVILTGMGADGAAGLLEMRQAGAATIAQDEKTSVVFGMPKEAIELGAADEVLPLSQIAAAMLRRAQASFRSP
ncbi:MAG: chemotaxis response regulator protein-glutamate methylesterase [Polyangiaceae bacterium]|nr:chemotaxis response regulator protein-glutamate methylesterase [Polyangiaceae bacterium]